MDQQSRRYRRHRKLYHRRRHIDKRCPPLIITEPLILSSPIRTRNASRGNHSCWNRTTCHLGVRRSHQRLQWKELTPPTSVKVLPATRQEATATNTVPAANRQVNGIYRRQASWLCCGNFKSRNHLQRTNKIVSMILHAKRTGLLPNTRQNPPGIWIL